MTDYSNCDIWMILEWDRTEHSEEVVAVFSTREKADAWVSEHSPLKGYEYHVTGWIVG